MAKTFKDSGDREWSVNVTVDVIEKVREIEIDLGDVTGEMVRRIALDDVLLVRVLWIICESQADAAQVTAPQFGEAMFGEALDNGFDALRGSLNDFFPPRKRVFWEKAVKAMLADQADSLKTGMEVLDDPEIVARASEAKRERVRTEINQALTRLRFATDSPDSPE